MFTPLTSENIAKIVGLQLKSVTKMLALQGITMDATPQAVSSLKGYDPHLEPDRKTCTKRSIKQVV
jgi:ATP-dependent Clp protease ATP-binding subunit ClpB